MEEKDVPRLLRFRDLRDLGIAPIYRRLCGICNIAKAFRRAGC